MIIKAVVVNSAVCGEGGRSYLGRSAPCPEFRTEPAVRRADRGAEVSRGHSSRRAYRRRRPERLEGRVGRVLALAMRQKTQLELAFPEIGAGEARNRLGAGTEAGAASAASESPAAMAAPCMEAIVDRDNLRKALAQVRRNKRASGVDGMSVGSRTAETA